MTVTVALIDALRARLQAALPNVVCEYFPEDPKNYRLNHPVGALLISYRGSVFEPTQDEFYIAQPRSIRLSITVVLKQLNGRGGAIEMLDQVRSAVIGWKPPHCNKKLFAEREKFLGTIAGLWQYALDVGTETIQVEDVDTEDGPLLHTTSFEEQD